MAGINKMMSRVRARKKVCDRIRRGGAAAA